MVFYRLSDIQHQETLSLKLRLRRRFLHVRIPGIYIHVYHDVWLIYHIFHSEGSGTSLIIVIGVVTETIQQIQLEMAGRNYCGILCKD